MSLQTALREIGQAANGAPSDGPARLDPNDRRDALALDLWISSVRHPGDTNLSSFGLQSARGILGGEREPDLIDPQVATDIPIILRDLSPAEKKLVAGGLGTTGGITVVGPPYDPWNEPWYPGLPNDPGYGYGGGGGGSGGPTDFLDNYYDQCTLDNKVDFKAQQIANLIKTMPDWNEREYGAMIYMTPDGEVRMSILYRGQTVAEAVALGQSAPHTTIGWPSDLNGGVVLAIIHSHPDVGYGNQQDLDNRYPSSDPGADYDTFDQLVASDPRFSNNAGFAQYILGPDGQLREFNARDGRITRLNDPNPSSRTNLAADRPCSG